MAETPAQRAARERNLRKGNDRAYSKAKGGSQGDEPPAPADPPADEGGKPTFRARSSKPPAKPRKPKQRRTPPRAPAPADDPPPPAKRGSGSGFFQGLREGFGG